MQSLRISAKNITRLAMICLIGSTLLVHVLVPYLLQLYRYDYVFGTGFTLVPSLYLIIIIPAAVVFVYFVTRKYALDIDLATGLKCEKTLVAAVVLLLWCLFYVLGHGLNVRELDVEQGYNARSVFLRLCAPFIGISQIFAAYLCVSLRANINMVHKLRNALVILLYIALLILSGSRGYFFTFLLTALIGMSLAFPPKDKLSVRGNVSARVAILWLLKKIIQLGLILGTFFAITSVMAIWGSIRDKQDDRLFSILFRFSEPFWYYAQGHWQSYGGDISLYADALQRIVSLPLRWGGMEFEGSVDGSDYFLSHYLSIQFVEGVALPITVVGHGFLAAGYWGVFVNLMIVACALFLVLRQCIKMQSLAYLPNGMLITFIAYLICKSLFIYSKSLSGTFLFIVYETFRDFIFMLIIFYPYRRIYAKAPA